MMKAPVVTVCASFVTAFLTTVYSSQVVKAEDACYLEMSRQHVNLTGICEGARTENSSIYDSTIFHIPSGESNLIVYGLECPWEWQANRWQEQQALTGKIGNLGSAAAHDISLTLRAEKLDEHGEVVQTEVREVVILEVPSRMVANFKAEFSFIPDHAVVEKLEWY